MSGMVGGFPDGGGRRSCSPVSYKSSSVAGSGSGSGSGAVGSGSGVVIFRATVYQMTELISDTRKEANKSQFPAQRAAEKQSSQNAPVYNMFRKIKVKGR